MRRLITAILVLVAGLGFLPPVTWAEDDIGPAGAESLPLSTTNNYAQVVYARSNSEAGQVTETVISIRNQSGAICTVTVQWAYGFGSTSTGVSGPYNIAAGDTVEFTTANSGERVEPFDLNAYRNSTTDFEGKAFVNATCAGTVVPKLGIQATLVLDINPTTRMGASYMDLNILKPGWSQIKGD